eukprot:915813-Pelagomonas_calceolata.AAC.2
MGLDGQAVCLTSSLDMDLQSSVRASKAIPPQPHSAMERESSTASRTCKSSRSNATSCSDLARQRTGQAWNNNKL